MKLLLVGQPNCGKSTIFNAAAGYKSATANFPGTSIGCTSSQVMVAGRDVELVDLPGTYSLTSQDETEREALRALRDAGPDVVLIDVVDASRLGRSLELTLQLLELRRPMVLALNMNDEAERRGMTIDPVVLSSALGIPVVPTIARRGVGLTELFDAAVRVGEAGTGAVAPVPRYDREIEGSAAQIEALIGGTTVGTGGTAGAGAAGGGTAVASIAGLPARLAALKLLERDPDVAGAVRPASPAAVEGVITELERLHGWPGEQVLSGARHALAHRIEERVTRLSPARPSRRERLDALLMHPVAGMLSLALVLAAFFWAVFGLGHVIEAPLVTAFDRLAATLGASLPKDTILGAIAGGVVLGIGGGVAIVLPYLLPFLCGLALLEDSGYLPRMAYLLDGVMHRLGLHGKSIVPLVLGYGCSVPAVLSTRILENPRDRRITAALAVLVPCAARSTVILGLVGAVLGWGAALGVYAVNILVVLALGLTLSRRVKGTLPGLVLEVPDLRWPSPRTIAAKTWLTLREFVLIAWPALILSSIVLGLLEIGGWTAAINDALAPLTVTLLGLPAVLGLTLVFGVMRKELALMMLVQALGTAAPERVMTPAQVISFALFVVFYIPCVSTLAALWHERGGRETAFVAGLSCLLAVALAIAGRALVTALG